MTWPNLVDGPEQVAPGASDLHVGLVDVPAVADDVPPDSGRVDELGGEALHPSVDRDVVDIDAALGEEFLDIAVGQTEPQVPADREGDDLGREAEPGEG
jgi:hypothetical protein